MDRKIISGLCRFLELFLTRPLNNLTVQCAYILTARDSFRDKTSLGHMQTMHAKTTDVSQFCIKAVYVRLTKSPSYLFSSFLVYTVKSAIDKNIRFDFHRIL